MASSSPTLVPPFTGASLDRVADLRADADAMAALVQRADAAWVGATASGVLVSAEDSGSAPSLLKVQADALGGGLAAEDAVLLGLVAGGRPLFALDLEELADARRDAIVAGGQVVSLRRAGSMLTQEDGGLAAYLMALLNWHRRHRFCSNCGAATALAEAGLSRRCASCGGSHFPRTDPVVIMTVSVGDRLLLGRRHGWDENRLSILAGFVAPGETPEEAVVREVGEESGIRAHSPCYVTSQPWPFPSSLMLGYDALAEDGDPVPQPGEMAAVRWASLEEVVAAQRGSDALILPPPVSIARLLIDRWVDERT